MFFALVGSFVETSHAMRCPLVWVAGVVAGVPAHRLKCGDRSRMRRMVNAGQGRGVARRTVLLSVMSGSVRFEIVE